MKTPRKTRKTVNEPYALISDTNPFPIMAILNNISLSGALFTLQGEMKLREHLYACPMPDIHPESLPTTEELMNHKNRLEALVVRKEKNNRFGVKFLSPLGKDRSATLEGRSAVGIKVEGEGVTAVISALGTLNLAETARLHAIVKEKVPSALRFIIDLSGVTKLPQTAHAILGDLLKHLMQKKRQTGLVNAMILGQRFLDQHPTGRWIKHFMFRHEADNYFHDHPITILVVEDEATTQNLIAKYLEHWQFKPVVVGTGEEGVKQVEKIHPHLILMDVHLPGIDGITAVQKIKENVNTHHIPIVMLTVESKKDTVVSSMKFNICGYVLKPFQPQILLERIITGMTESPVLTF